MPTSQLKVVRPWTGRDAVSPELASFDADQLTSQLSDGLPVVVGFAPTTDLKAAMARLVSTGAEVVWTDGSGLVPQAGLRVPVDAVDAVRRRLAEEPTLLFAEPQGGAVLRNGRSAWRCQSGISGLTPVFDHGLHGENQIIGVMDTGIDPDHCFFVDPAVGLPVIGGDTSTAVGEAHRKLLAVDFWWSEDGPPPGSRDWDDQGHGSHVAGSAAGDHDGDGLAQGDDGMAPAAKLVIQDGGYRVDTCGDLPGLGCPMRPLGPMLEQAWQQGARIHTNSWGDEEEIYPFNRYTERTADIDRFVWQHPEMLVLVAAGNAGSFNDTVGSPATGKNLIGVGAIWQADVEPPCPASFSSRGWTHDGRIKPDIMAPGTAVRSAATDFVVDGETCGLTEKSGTSMASPTAAGLAALVRQYFTDGWYPRGLPVAAARRTPSAALLKAMLIASAVDMRSLGCSTARPVPSRDQGWGLIELDRVLYFAGDDHGLVVEDRASGFDSSTDAGVVIPVEVHRTGAMKIVLAWTDPPSTSTAATNLVNDLDLVVEGPDGRYLGNVFVDGTSHPGGEADRLNNVEVVWLPDAGLGVWKITVEPHRVQLGPQPWALVATGSVGALTIRRGGARLEPR
jgi:hypothetical protein